MWLPWIPHFLSDIEMTVQVGGFVKPQEALGCKGEYSCTCVPLGVCPKQNQFKLALPQFKRNLYFRFNLYNVTMNKVCKYLHNFLTKCSL